MKKVRQIIKEYFIVSLFTFIVALSFNLFFLPFQMVIGGSSGVSIVLNFLFNLTPSVVVLIIHIVALVFGYFVLGWKKISKSIYGSLAYPLFVQLSSPVKDFMISQNIGSEHLFIMIVLGALMNGFASGIVYKYGYTTGGSDIFNQMIQKFTGVTMGTANFIFNGSIVLFGGYILGWSKVLYAILILYIIGLATDRSELGGNSNKIFYIKTKKEEEVSSFIQNTLHTKLTKFQLIKDQSKDGSNMLMCAIPNRDYYKLKEGITEIDGDAVFMVSHAYELEQK